MVTLFLLRLRRRYCRHERIDWANCRPPACADCGETRFNRNKRGWVAPRNGGYSAIGPDRPTSPPPPGPGSASSAR